MQCPFCAEDFNSGALVCKSCGRDLRLVTPLLQENLQLIQRIGKLQAQADRLRASRSRSISPLTFWLGQLSVYVFAPVVLLLAAHTTIIVLLNVPLLYLRLASIAVPVPFGFALLWSSHHGVRWALSYGGIVGCLSVAGMLTVVGYVDSVPVLPENAREWRESLEYAASIMLAYVAGHVFALLFQRLLPGTLDPATAPSPSAMAIARMAGAHVGERAVLRRAQRISNKLGTIGTALIALGAAGGSLYTGIRTLAGKAF